MQFHIKSMQKNVRLDFHFSGTETDAFVLALKLRQRNKHPIVYRKEQHISTDAATCAIELLIIKQNFS